MFDLILAVVEFIIIIVALCYVLTIMVEKDVKYTTNKKSTDNPHIISDPIVYSLNYNKTHDEFDEYLHPEDKAIAKSKGIDFEQNEYDFANTTNYTAKAISDMNHKSAKDNQKSIKFYGSESI